MQVKSVKHGVDVIECVYQDGAVNDVAQDLYCGLIDVGSINSSVGLQQYLSSDEIERANHFVFDSDKTQFELARASVRLMLSELLQCHPRQIQFDVNQYGKPFLKPSENNRVIDFNISHCDGCVFIAIAEENQIGIDVENISRDVDYIKIAQRFFHPNEIAYLKNLDPFLQKKSFFWIWVCKEAFVKARNVGLSYGFEKFYVEFNRAGFPYAIFVDDPQEQSSCYLYPFEVSPNYIAAIVLSNEIEQENIVVHRIEKYFNGHINEKTYK